MGLYSESFVTSQEIELRMRPFYAFHIKTDYYNASMQAKQLPAMSDTRRFFLFGLKTSNSTGFVHLHLLKLHGLGTSTVVNPLVSLFRIHVSLLLGFTFSRILQTIEYNESLFCAHFILSACVLKFSHYSIDQNEYNVRY